MDGRAIGNGESPAHWSDMLVAQLVDEFDPVEVWLFGSVARGNDNADSDINVLVVLDTSTTQAMR